MGVGMRYELLGAWYSLYRPIYNIFNKETRNHSYTRLYEMVNNKSVCIVGNSDIVLKKPNPIDKYDIVVRFNKAFPRGNTESLGYRTDILVSAYYISPQKIEMEYGDPFLFWAFWEEYAHPYWGLNSLLYRWEDRLELRKELGGYEPSSGMIIIDFLLKYCMPREIHLYGFDFLKTPTWWVRELTQEPHNGAKEEEYVKMLQKRYKIEVHE